MTDESPIPEPQNQDEALQNTASDASGTAADEKNAPTAGVTPNGGKKPANVVTGSNSVKFSKKMTDKTGINLKTLLGDPFSGRSIMNMLPASAATYEHLRNSMDALKDEMANDNQFNKIISGSAMTLSLGLSAGYVVWLIRGGMLLASVLSSIQRR